MTEIIFRTHRENRVWSPLPVEPLVAEYGKVQVGSYHGSGYAVQAYVAGWPEAVDGLSVEDWRQGCLSLKGSRFYFNVRPYGRNYAVSFSLCREDVNVFETFCPSAIYSSGLEVYIIPAQEKDNLDFLTR